MLINRLKVKWSSFCPIQSDGGRRERSKDGNREERQEYQLDERPFQI